MSEALNVALVGYGFVGRVFHAPLIATTPGLRLHTVVSRDAAKVHADLPDVRVLAEPAHAFADGAIDLVVVAAPNAVHASLAIAALQAGRHVLVDKPFTTSLDEARRVLEVARATGRLASVFQNRRWDSDFLALRSLLESGALGEPAELHSHFDRFRPQVPDRWRERAGPGAGLWFDLGPHLVDQALQLFGMPLSIQADIAAQRADAVVDDWFHVVLHYPRLRVVLHAGALVAANTLRLAAHGTGGSYVKHGLDPQEDALRAGTVPGAGDWGHDPSPGILTTIGDTGPVARVFDGPRGDYRACYAAMRDAILGRGEPPVTPAQALEVLQVLEAGVASAASGRRISLEAASS
ncbi:oxidoreductase [Luteimonas sp. M1R5S18]|uniref:Oxidoreductase n=1 Tax=Luteimonas rhizosphaericola TaxID=3042024 RepID=A0ABT6JKR3_9GAMM|nr:oxidoreductase [Luteimonas rhizosphaericola]MDH5831075.1 oxidoreductase [Luteimonas rhizosphaericola]